MEQKMFDTKAVQKHIDEQHQQQQKAFREGLQGINKDTVNKQTELNELFAKAVLSEREVKEKQRTKEVEKEKSRAIADVEARYEDKGVKSTKQIKKEKAYKSLLNGLKGLAD